MSEPPLFGRLHLHTHPLCVHNLPAVACGLIGGTRDGDGSVQVRGLTLPPPPDFPAKPDTLVIPFFQSRSRVSTRTGTRLPVPSGVGDQALQPRRPHSSTRVGIKLSPPCSAALQLNNPSYTVGGPPLYQDRIFMGGSTTVHRRVVHRTRGLKSVIFDHTTLYDD